MLRISNSARPFLDVKSEEEMAQVDQAGAKSTNRRCGG
jgi:hypothetical protein